MKHWNAWGDDSIHAEIPLPVLALVRDAIGYGTPLKDLSLEAHLERVPTSRIPRHPLVTTTPKERLDHSHGSSIPEWIELHCGDLRRYVDGVAFPRTSAEVEEAIQFADANKILIIPFGGGSSVAGQLKPPDLDRPVMALSLKRLQRLIAIDAPNRLAVAEAGIAGPDLEAGLNAAGFKFGHFPKSFEYSTLGGWVMTRSSGLQANYYGDLDSLFMGGELATPKGVMTLSPFPTQSVGPDIRRLVLGSEGRLGVLTQVNMKITPMPEEEPVFGFLLPDWAAAVAAFESLIAAELPLTLLNASAALETRLRLALAGGEQTVISQVIAKTRNRAGSPPDDNRPGDAPCLIWIGLAGTRNCIEFSQKRLFFLMKGANALLLGKTRSQTWLKNRFREPYLKNSLRNLGYIQDVIQAEAPCSKAISALAALEQEVSGALAGVKEKIFTCSQISPAGVCGVDLQLTIIFRQGATAAETLSRWKTIKSAANRAALKAGIIIGTHFGVGVDQITTLENDKGALGTGLLRQLFHHSDPDGIMNPGKITC